MVLLAVLLVAAFLLVPTQIWDGHKSFVLTLSSPAADATAALFFCDGWNSDCAQGLCDFSRNEKTQDCEQRFRPVTFTPDGRFTVDVPTFGTAHFLGLWRTSHVCEYVVLMGKMKTGERVFKVVPVVSTEPIELK